MAFDLRKMSFGQIAAIGGGLFVLVMVIAAVLISASSKPQQKVVTKRQPAQFEAPAVSDVEMQALRAEIKQLRERVEQNAQSTQAAFAQTAAAIDQQGKNIHTLDNNVQVTTSRLSNLEKARIGARVNVVKPEEQAHRPTRAERLAAADRKSGTAPMQLGSTNNYQPLATVGGRAWIRNGDEEMSVKEGEAIPIQGQLVVRQIKPSGQVSVAVESAH